MATVEVDPSIKYAALEGLVGNLQPVATNSTTFIHKRIIVPLERTFSKQSATNRERSKSNPVSSNIHHQRRVLTRKTCVMPVERNHEYQKIYIDLIVRLRPGLVLRGRKQERKFIFIVDCNFGRRKGQH